MSEQRVPVEWRSAIISSCGAYRYQLVRRLGGIGPTIVWVMLNPSTADHEQDDPTIRRVLGFSGAWGFAHVAVVNLFALRSTDPAALLRDPIAAVGPDNDGYLTWWGHRAPRVVAAWGSIDRRLRSRVTSAMCALDARLWCLGETRDGSPRHPLYVRADMRLSPWNR